MDSIEKSEKMAEKSLKALEKLLPYLNLKKFKYANTDTHACALELVQLWTSLLKAASKKWSSQYLKAIIIIIKREELLELKNPNSDEKFFVLAKIFRILLYDTELVVENLLILHLKKYKGKFSANPVSILDLCSQFLAVSCQRIPNLFYSILKKLCYFSKLIYFFIYFLY